MNIEQAIKDLTEALNENTATLKAIHAASDAIPVAAPEPKPAKGKKTKAKAEPEPEPAPEPEPEPVQDDVPEDADGELTRDEQLARITAHVKAACAASGDKLLTKKEEFETIRDKFGIARAKDLTDDQLAPFWEAIQAL